MKINMKKVFSFCLPLLLAAVMLPGCGKSDPKDPGTPPQKEDPVKPAPEPEPEAAPQADLLDVVFSPDGSAKDVSTGRRTVRYLPGADLVTYQNEVYGRCVAAFNRKMGSSVSSGFYRVDYADDEALRKALADGHSLEVVFKANHTSDGSAEVKVFSSHQSGGTGFLISTSARGTQFNFLPNVSTDGKSKWIWTPCGFTPQAGVYYHAVGVWNKKEGKSYLYVDGVMKGKSDASGELNFPTPASCLWFGIGGDPGGDNADSAWDGEVVLARIYDDPLTASQVKLLYEQVKQPVQPPHLEVSDVSFLPEARVSAGNRYRIYGKGFKEGDKIRFVTEDGSRQYDCETTFGDGFVAAEIPATLAEGSYKLFAVRGDGVLPLGRTRIHLGGTPASAGGTKIVAHRGFHTSSVSENSIAALKKAQELGIYGAEFDVWITLDGVVVVNHDPKLPGDSHTIQDSNFADIKDVKLSNGEKVPTLEDYLLQGKEDKDTRLVLEIKSHSTAARNNACVDACVAMVKEMGLTEQVDWIAFSLDNCKRVKSLLPDATVEYLSGNMDPASLHALGIDGIDYQTTVLDAHPDWIGAAHDLGMVVNVWTVDGSAAMLKYIGQGVDFITTNKPDLLKELLSRTYITAE